MAKQTQKTAALLRMQKNEITEHLIYSRIARVVKDNHNKGIISRIAKDELRHHNKLIEITKTHVAPNMLKVWFYYIIARVLGLSFGLKLMERGEEMASETYDSLSRSQKELKSISVDEQKHEKALLNVLSEERLEYAGSIILGLNDALVELTGALAGLTLALQDSKLIRLAGLVTGFAASLSMAVSGYLSSKEEADKNEHKKPLKAALYTGVAYIVTVLLLVMPYFFDIPVFVSLAMTLAIALLIVFLYTFYITTAKGIPFLRRFLEMAVLSTVIAGISFLAGLLLKTAIG